ncbi:MAG: restriction endonuclease subunit S [Bacteroidota bacterium]|nr:restriction endonuclease subunit S [Bacteroidota bacterium]
MIDDAKIYKRCRVKLYGNGVVLRDPDGIEGKEIKTKRQQVCKTNDFLVAEIDAKFGGYGIVPTELNGAIVSSHYFLFEIDTTQLLSEFLEIVVKCNDFSKQVKSTGSTNYSAIRPYHVLGYLIPLPSLEEQNILVQAYNNRIAEAKRLEDVAKSLEKGIKKYLFDQLGVVKNNCSIAINGLSFLAYKEIERWALSHLLKRRLYSFKNVKHPILPIKTLLTFFEGGKTPSTSRNDFWGGDIYWTSAKDMKELYLKNAQDRITNLAVKEGGLKVYPKGTLLGVFRSGILRHSFPVALTEVETAINQDLKAMGINEELVLKEYFLNFLNVFQKMILERSQKEGVTVESINTYEFLEIPVIIPPIETQRIISAQIQSIRNEVANKKNQAGTNRQLAISEFESKIFMPCN